VHVHWHRNAVPPEEREHLEGRKSLRRGCLSVVVPIYNEEANLRELQRMMREAVDSMGFDSAEVLLISDGSTDRSESIIADIVREDSLFRGIVLTRNFGHQAAVSVGLEQSRGSVIAVIDGDLQDPPHEIARLVDAIEQGADIAYGVRKRRKEGIAKRFAYFCFYRLLRLIANIDIPLDSGDFCCMTREVVDALLRLPERNRFIRGLRAWVGYRQVGVEYERAARFAGKPAYTLPKLIELAYDGLFSFSRVPIRLIQFMGFAVSTIALLVALFYFGLYFLRPELYPLGFATLSVSIWLLAGVQLLFMGIIGEYVVRTFDEARRRPTALIRQYITHPDEQAPYDAAPASQAPQVRRPPIYLAQGDRTLDR